MSHLLTVLQLHRGNPRQKRYGPVKNHSDPSTYPVIPLCPVATCGQPLVRRDGLIVCSADSWHYTQEVIVRRDSADHGGARR